jgi:hypothetical protein
VIALLVKLALIFGKLAGLGVVALVALVAIIGSLDTGTFTAIVLSIVAFVSPLILKKIPAHDGRMLLVCIGLSLILSLIGVFASGGFQLDWHNVQQVGLATAAFMGLQQTFYAALRDALRLDQP